MAVLGDVGRPVCLVAIGATDTLCDRSPSRHGALLPHRSERERKQRNLYGAFAKHSANAAFVREAPVPGLYGTRAFAASVGGESRRFAAVAG